MSQVASSNKLTKLNVNGLDDSVFYYKVVNVRNTASLDQKVS
jgi:hypothetical protein